MYYELSGGYPFAYPWGTMRESRTPTIGRMSEKNVPRAFPPFDRERLNESAPADTAGKRAWRGCLNATRSLPWCEDNKSQGKYRRLV